MTEKMHRATCACIASKYAPCDCGAAEDRRNAALASADARYKADGPAWAGPVCRGSYALGTGCGRCDRCRAELDKVSAARLREAEAGKLNAALVSKLEAAADEPEEEERPKANNYLDRMENLTQDNARLKRQMMELLMAFRDYAHEEFMRSVKEWKEENARKLRDTIDAIAHDSAPD